MAVTVGCAVPLSHGVLSLSWPKVDGVITHSRDMPDYRVIGVEIGYRYATVVKRIRAVASAFSSCWGIHLP